MRQCRDEGRRGGDLDSGSWSEELGILTVQAEGQGQSWLVSYFSERRWG
jgi:hypothetical protein